MSGRNHGPCREEIDAGASRHICERGGRHRRHRVTALDHFADHRGSIDLVIEWTVVLDEPEAKPRRRARP